MGQNEGALDQAKGRVKEAAGSLTENEELKREGRTDQAAGKLKDKIGKLVDRARDAISGDAKKARKARK